MSRDPLYALCRSEPWITTRTPLRPLSVAAIPLGDWVNVVSPRVLICTSCGIPLLNSTLTRSYVSCAPVRSELTNATGGVGVGAVVALKTKSCWTHVKAGSCASGVADGLGPGDALGDAPGLAVGAPTPAFEVGRLNGLPTNSTPTTSTAITHAATVAIQKGPRASGAWAIDERTRSRRAGLGEPLISSNVWFSSRRKFSLLTSEHLLHREVSPQPLRGAVDARLGGGR